MKILIVDDEPLARARLRELLRDSGAGHTTIEAENGITALELVQRENPDVVLMDIRMPGMDGLETAIHLTRLAQPPAVIFTTANDGHALQAFESSAIDYLLKPVREERLIHALNRARLLQDAQLVELRRRQPDSRRRSHLSIRSHEGLQLVPVHEVAYLRADQKYVAVAWGNRELLLDEPLKSLEEEFSALFLRIHRNALVARSHIMALERQPDGTVAIRLRAVAESMPVSRRHLAEVRSALKEMAG